MRIGMFRARVPPVTQIYAPRGGRGRRLNNAANRHPSCHRYHRRPSQARLYVSLCTWSEAKEYPSLEMEKRPRRCGDTRFSRSPGQWTIRPPLCPRHINCLFEARWPPRIWLSSFPSLPPASCISPSRRHFFFHSRSFLLAFLDALSRT